MTPESMQVFHLASFKVSPSNPAKMTPTVHVSSPIPRLAGSNDATNGSSTQLSTLVGLTLGEDASGNQAFFESPPLASRTRPEPAQPPRPLRTRSTGGQPMNSLERPPHPPSPTWRDSPGGSRGGSKTAAASDDVSVDAVSRLFAILPNPSHRFLATLIASPVINRHGMAWSGAETILVPSSRMSDHDVALTGSVVSRITSRTALTKSTHLDATPQTPSPDTRPLTIDRTSTHA